MEIYKQMLKRIRKCKGPILVKTMLKKNKVRRVRLSDSKKYKVKEIKIV